MADYRLAVLCAAALASAPYDVTPNGRGLSLDASTAAAADLGCVNHGVGQRDIGFHQNEEYFFVRNGCQEAVWYAYVTNQKSGMRLRRVLQLSPGETVNTDGGVSIVWVGSCAYRDRACYPYLSDLVKIR